MITQTLVLPWKTPPLRSNDRMHYHVKARITAEIRETTRLLGKQLKPVGGAVVVRMTWQVCNERIRDAGASAPTAKAAIDGLVDAGVITGDHWRIVVEERYRIVMGPKPELRLEILPVPASGLAAS